MTTKTLTATALILCSTASFAQSETGSQPELKNGYNHIKIEAGTGSGVVEDEELSGSEINYTSLSLKLGYEYHLRNDFRFQVYLMNEASEFNRENENLNAPYFAFEARLGILAPVMSTNSGFSLHVGSNYAFSTRFANWEMRNEVDGQFSSLSAHHLNAAVQVEFQKNRWRASAGLSMPVIAYVYRSNDPSITIENGEVSPLFENGEWVAPDNYLVPEASLKMGYKLTSYLELSLNYNYDYLNSSVGASSRQVEHQIRLGATLNF
ncbi:MAG: hypothetical protein HWD92_04915 [Flavobacteriia bacterium]|nr:hypothetical protein [Flavobacteriia bacterium]